MKMYSGKSGSNSTLSKNFFARNMYVFLVAGVLAVLSIVIALSVIFTRDKSEDVASPPYEPTYALPLDDINVLQEVSLKKPVYNPTLNEWRTVNGITFSASDIGDKVKAISDGEVISTRDSVIEGRVVVIQNVDGTYAIYKSLSKEDEDNKPTVGEKVVAGDIIGTTSDEFLNNKHFGKQLYLEVKTDVPNEKVEMVTVPGVGKLVDPTTLLPSFDK